MLIKYKEIFDELSNEKMGEIKDLSRQIDLNNLTYYFKSKTFLHKISLALESNAYL